MTHRTAPGISKSYRAPASAPASLLIVFYALLAVVYWIFHWQRVVDMWREDLPVYAHAVHAWVSGGDPYSPAMAPLYFLYPPAFLILAGLFAHLVPAGWGESLYTAWHIAATCAIPVVLARWFLRQSWLSIPFALLLFFASPQFTGFLALCTLNIASTAYCLAFLAAIPGLRRERWIWFYCAVFLAAMVKITFLGLLLLPFFVGRRQWRNSIFCGAAVVAGNLLERVLLPQLYAGYQWSLLHGILKEGAYGFGVFAIVDAYGYKAHIPSPAGAYAAAVLQAAVLVACLFVLRHRLVKRERTDRDLTDGWTASWPQEMRGAWIALVVTALILVNPRLLQYDADISLLAAYVLWVYALRTRRLLLTMVVVFVPWFAMPFLVKALHLRGMYGTLETLAAFGFAWWRLWREADSGQEPEPEAVLIAEAGA